MSAPVHWDPEVLERVAHLRLVARHATLGLLHGEHKSLRTASNVEFADYKAYTPGDPLRDLDWKVAARTDRLVVRRHRAETELPVTLAVDLSGDLGTGAAGRTRRPPFEGSKAGVAITLAASLAWFLHQRSEPVGLEIWGGEGIATRSLAPRRGAAHVQQVLAVLAAAHTAGTGVLRPGIEALGARLRRRQVVVVLSDFMEEPVEWGPALSALGRTHADLRAVHLYDPREWALDYPDAARFYSPEGGDDLPLDAASVRERFQQIVKDYVAEVKAAIAPQRGVHVLVPTDAPLDRAVARIVRGLP